jgi:hypothetical protein
MNRPPKSGAHWPCYLLPNVKVTSSYLSDHCAIYKRPPTLQAGVRDSFPLSPRELLELSAHLFVTPVHLQYEAAEYKAITSKEGPEAV